MLLALVSIVAGIALLAKGADWLVDGASSLAKRLGVAPIVIGLTIVAFGTSTPELVVNLVAVNTGNPAIAIGNIIGSNIANILLILGICAVIAPLTIKSGTVWKEIPFALLAVALVAVLASDAALADRLPNALDRIDGLALLALFGVFMYYTFGIAKVEGEAGDTPQSMKTSRAAGFILFGLAGLVAGGKFTVDGAVAIASALGVTDRVIGLTVVAVGTSLPELMTSVVATRKGQDDIAVGNVVGSNIFNVFFILGISAFLAPLPFSADSMRDTLVAVGATTLLFVAMFIGRKHVMERWQGWAFIACYGAYVVSLI